MIRVCGSCLPYRREEVWALLPQWRFLHWYIRLNTSSSVRWLFSYTSITEKPCRTNRILAIYAVSCDCQMFQVNFIPSLILCTTEKLPFGSLLYVPKRCFAFCREGLETIDGSPCGVPGHNCAAFSFQSPEPSAIHVGNRWKNMATKLRTDRSCETFQVDYNERKNRFYTSKAAES